VGGDVGLLHQSGYPKRNGGPAMRGIRNKRRAHFLESFADRLEGYDLPQVANLSQIRGELAMGCANIEDTVDL